MFVLVAHIKRPRYTSTEDDDVDVAILLVPTSSDESPMPFRSNDSLLFFPGAVSLDVPLSRCGSAEEHAEWWRGLRCDRLARWRVFELILTDLVHKFDF